MYTEYVRRVAPTITPWFAWNPVGTAARSQSLAAPPELLEDDDDAPPELLEPPELEVDTGGVESPPPHAASAPIAPTTPITPNATTDVNRTLATVTAKRCEAIDSS
jgi:hypothetical protein